MNPPTDVLRELDRIMETFKLEIPEHILTYQKCETGLPGAQTALKLKFDFSK